MNCKSIKPQSIANGERDTTTALPKNSAMRGSGTFTYPDDTITSYIGKRLRVCFQLTFQNPNPQRPPSKTLLGVGMRWMQCYQRIYGSWSFKITFTFGICCLK